MVGSDDTTVESEPMDWKNFAWFNATPGIKNDQDKLKWSLVPWKEMEEVVKVLMHGANKYSPNNWKYVDKERYKDALLRHVIAYLGGERVDLESGSSHLAHAICNILFLMWHEKQSEYTYVYADTGPLPEVQFARDMEVETS